MNIMIKLENIIADDLHITLNSFLYNSINLFKYNNEELNNYIMNKCRDNPLIYIDEDSIPLSVLSYKQKNQPDDILSELFQYFNCTLSGRNQLIMNYLIYSLNSNGFLEADTNEIALLMRTKKDIVEQLIILLQNYDNRGIGCKDITSFLAFQLKLKQVYNENLFSIFTSHLEDIQKHDYSFLKSIDVKKTEFLSYVELIKDSCELFPLSGENSSYTSPDAAITLDENNTFSIQINDCLIDSVTFEAISLDTGRQKFKRKIESYKKDYEELVSILNARKVYLADILTIIVNVQNEYQLGNTSFLNTLDQNMLSDYTSLSPATISRLLHNKFVSTPRGIFPVKSLLSKKCSKNASVSYVMHFIKNLAGFEKMSDNKISTILKEQGISISRRTVNKYKNQLLKQISF